MSNLINWIKTHKALTVLLLIAAYFGWQFIQSFFGVRLTGFNIPQQSSYSGGSGGIYGNVGSVNLQPPAGVSTGIDLPSFSMEKRSDTSTTPTERMVVQNSNLSLLVKDVRETGDKVLKYAKDSGGYMVTTSYNRPSESPFATITIRVPANKFDDALNNFRALAIKVTNENLVGTDVTEQYEDIEASLQTLERTKARLLTFLDLADNVTQLLQVQREIINVQNQIDSLVGRKNKLEQEVAMAKITVYLSTDELSLPYTPDTKFRPNVIFKLAVRSLLNTLRLLGEAAIWVGVYAVIWIPALVIIVLYKRFKKTKASKAQV